MFAALLIVLIFGAFNVIGGTISVLSYNVAGLPPIFNKNKMAGSKASNARLIGHGLGAGKYSIVHVQEDFNFHKALYSTARFPHRTSTSGGVPFGSGLNTLSQFPWTELKRIKWRDCHPNEGDCLTPKGFTLMRMKVADGVEIDLYNLHADAGDQAGDVRAREHNFAQMRSWIDHHSSGYAVIVAGDTNQRYTNARGSLDPLLKGSGLKDAWVELTRKGVAPLRGESVPGCPVPAESRDCEVVDKIFYRSGTKVHLEAKSFYYPSEQFRRPDHKTPSDHNPILVHFEWQLR